MVGLKKPADRAALIEYLRQSADNLATPPKAAEAMAEMTDKAEMAVESMVDESMVDESISEYIKVDKAQDTDSDTNAPSPE